ncbi:MAG: carboxypeptidase-like regulatory domain-containing protein [Leptolyngbyaceae cyanobacterium]
MIAPTRKYSIRLKYFHRLSLWLNGLGLVLLCAQPGWSHGAIATVTQTFSVQASYTSGQPMAEAQVIVYSPEKPDEPWTTGQTSEQGEFEFNPDTQGNWEVVIRQAGHGTSVSVPVNTQAAQRLEHRLVSTGSTTVIASEPLTVVQRWASAGAAFWGLIGTVLFFSRGKSS